MSAWVSEIAQVERSTLNVDDTIQDLGSKNEWKKLNDVCAFISLLAAVSVKGLITVPTLMPPCQQYGLYIQTLRQSKSFLLLLVLGIFDSVRRK